MGLWKWPSTVPAAQACEAVTWEWSGPPALLWACRSEWAHQRNVFNAETPPTLGAPMLTHELPKASRDAQAESSWKRKAAGPKVSSPCFFLQDLCSFTSPSMFSGCSYMKLPFWLPVLSYTPEVSWTMTLFKTLSNSYKEKELGGDLPVNQIFLNFPLCDLDWVKHLKIMLRSSNQSESNRVGSNSL